MNLGNTVGSAHNCNCKENLTGMFPTVQGNRVPSSGEI